MVILNNRTQVYGNLLSLQGRPYRSPGEGVESVGYVEADSQHNAPIPHILLNKFPHLANSVEGGSLPAEVLGVGQQLVPLQVALTCSLLFVLVTCPPHPEGKSAGKTKVRLPIYSSFSGGQIAPSCIRKTPLPQTCGETGSPILQEETRRLRYYTTKYAVRPESLLVAAT